MGQTRTRAGDVAEVRMARLATASGLSLALAVTACEGDPEPPPADPVPVLLARVDGWVRVADASEDVFGAERPDGLTCDEEMGLILEDLGPDVVFEIKTDLCNYATVRQPSLQPLVAGDTVKIRAWHYDLDSADAAAAHIALAIDGEPMWETNVPIPSPGAIVEGEIVVDRALPAGTELQWHVHNHGPNSYDLVRIQGVPTGEAE